MDIQFGNLTQLAWLWLPATAAGVILFAAEARRRARRRFATANLIDRAIPASSKVRRAVSALLLLGSMALMAITLIDVRWGKVEREIPQKGIEVVFVLDVSRSMLAEDAAPNRLARAKQQIKDMVDEMAGDRVGLVVFAGESRQQIPLTTHYGDFKRMLDEVGPHNVRRGGSRLGEAIETASKSFLTKLNAHKAIVVFTDGEDQESDPVAVARQAHEETGVRIFTVGLGDMEKGSRIPVAEGRGQGYLQHDGEQVWSKLNGDVLRQVAMETDGAYVPAGIKQVDMADVYHRFVASVEQVEFDAAQVSQYEARYQWLLGPALLLLVGEILISTWPAKRSAVASVGNAGMQHSVEESHRHSLTAEHSTAA